MNSVPLCWPDAEALAGQPRGSKFPFAPLVETASGAFGFVVAPTREAVRDIQKWMQRPGFRLRLVVDLYPTCPTREEDLEALRELVAGLGENRLAAHVIARDGVGDRGTNALLFFDETLDRSSVVIGPTDDLGRAPAGIGQVTMAFDADSDLVDAFRRHFELAWKRSVSILARGTTSIPLLALPPGTEAGVRAWEDYLARLSVGPQTHAAAGSEPANPASVGNEAVHAAERDPLGALSLPVLDEFAVGLSDLYRRGHVVVVDKHSRVPPLDAPIRPSLLGEEAESQVGALTRRVSMSVSAIDPKTRGQIEKHRTAIGRMLPKFTFALADGLRWMPNKARPLFEAELGREEAAGSAALAALLNCGVKAYVELRRPRIERDIAALWNPGTPLVSLDPGPSPQVVEGVLAVIQARLEKASAGRLLPTFNYMPVGFSPAEDLKAGRSPWGQVLTLLLAIARYPRRAFVDNFFWQGLRVSRDALLDAMDVAGDDLLLSEQGTQGFRARCEGELACLDAIEAFDASPRKRSEAVWQLLKGASTDEVGSLLSQPAPRSPRHNDDERIEVSRS